ncbi:MAG: response regulator [Candidatus Zapsychrus exili]|nr:response regulator [Candidatus Zapsychrus exili]
MSKKILIVEDEEDMLETLKYKLESEGHIISCASDGEEGYQKYKEINPDLIILDLGLPKITGEEICRRIRKDDSDWNTKILMLTARNTEVDKIAGRVKGADKYMFKPFEWDELIENINSLLNAS